MGRRISLNAQATRDNFKWFFMPPRVNVPPMENRARGRVTNCQPKGVVDEDRKCANQFPVEDTADAGDDQWVGNQRFGCKSSALR